MTFARAFPRIAPGLFLALGAMLAHPPAAAGDSAPPIQVQDDKGRTVLLAGPARRAVTLAPHATELVYAAGAGDRLIATIRGSDYPPAARQLPVIGDGTQPDAERVAAVRPDLSLIHI